MRKATVVVTAVLAASIGGAVLTAAAGHATTTCSAKITITGPTQGKLVLAPAAVKIKVGQCVQFTNATSASLSLTVTQGDKTVFTATMAKGAVLAGKNGFVATTAARDTITVSEKALLNLGTYHGSGSITVKPTATPSPSHSPSPSPSGHKPSPRSTPTKKKPTPAKTHHKSHPKPHATGIKLPPLPPLPSTGVTVPVPKGTNPLVAPGPSTAPAVTDSSTPVAAIYAGPIEHAVDNSRGLPIAIGVLVVLGLASGWGRVLLATTGPVDSRREGHHRI